MPDSTTQTTAQNGEVPEKIAIGVDVQEKQLASISPPGTNDNAAQLKRDKHGLLLSPQPTADPMDPLNWPKWLKRNVLTQISLVAYLNLLSASLVTPAFFPVSLTFHRSLTDTTYLAFACIGVAGISPFLWNPLSNLLGHRPIWLRCLAGSVPTSAASGSRRGRRGCYWGCR